MALNQKDLILYNDHINSFHTVRNLLITVCEHNFIQAEQCLLITHNVGYCQIKQGDIMDILEQQRLLQQAGLTVDIKDPVNYSKN
jgi:ATP-dependent Clp protease adaptor protein ClpS